MFDPTTSEESLLLGRLNRVETNSTGYFAVHLHLSDLQRQNRQAHFVEIAARCFDNLLDNHEATLFPLSNADLALVCRNVPVDDVDPVIDKVRALFSEDPLTSIDEGGFEDGLSTWYDLSVSEDFAAFFHIATDLSMAADRRRDEAAKSRKEAQERDGNPLGPMNLAAINQKLQGAQVADLIHQQTCLQVDAGGDGKVLFHENFISMAELKKRIAPDVNLFASPWLFQYLTETLDRRILVTLAEHDFDELPEIISIISAEPMVRVMDRGPGFPDSEKERIFKRFQRSDRRFGGAGLGLSIVQRTADIHSGTVDIEDRSGGGSIFALHFPGDLVYDPLAAANDDRSELASRRPSVPQRAPQG